MSQTQGYSPILYDYLKKYQDDPTSRVFAPLAEAYRKAGMIDEAIEIAREGLRVHPHFVGGKVALARALYDKQSFAEVIEVLSSVVRDAPDNLVAQRLMAESCLVTGRTLDALNAYKMLLFFSPTDRELAKIVAELEVQAYEKGSLVLRTDPKPAPEQEENDFEIKSASAVVQGDTRHQKDKMIRQVEFLTRLLQNIERHRNSSL